MGMNEIKKLNDREHLLLRPAMYIGAVDKTESSDFIINGETISYESISIVPGLIKIINEIIDNSIDASIRTNFKFGTNISIKITDTEVQVKDDGTGISSKKVGEHYPAELAWGHARAGSNFDDTNRITVGMNGVGSFCTNVYSTKFVGESDDGVKCIKFTSKNNAETFKVEEKPTRSSGTVVTFEPDLKRFKLDKIDDTHKNVIYQRLINLSICYPEINFKFNGKSIKVSNFKKLAQMFHPNAEVYESPQIKIAIVPNSTDDFKQYSYVNGLKISDGGTHIEEITSKVVSLIREKLQRKYKNIKPGDIKNKLTTIVFMNGFPNAKFNSQSKEKLTNSIKEFNDFAKIDYKFVNKIFNNKSIIEPIVEVYKIKEEFENRKALKSVETKKKLKSEKYFKCTGTPKYLCICEGFSAYGGISAVLGNKDIEYYVLKGKLKNCWDDSLKIAMSNREIQELAQLIQNGVTECPLQEGEFYEIEVNSEKYIVNENDLITLEGVTYDIHQSLMRLMETVNKHKGIECSTMFIDLQQRPQ